MQPARLTPSTMVPVGPADEAPPPVPPLSMAERSGGGRGLASSGDATLAAPSAASPAAVPPVVTCTALRLVSPGADREQRSTCAALLRPEPLPSPLPLPVVLLVLGPASAHHWLLRRSPGTVLVPAAGLQRSAAGVAAGATAWLQRSGSSASSGASRRTCSLGSTNGLSHCPLRTHMPISAACARQSRPPLGALGMLSPWGGPGNVIDYFQVALWDEPYCNIGRCCLMKAHQLQILPEPQRST